MDFPGTVSRDTKRIPRLGVLESLVESWFHPLCLQLAKRLRWPTQASAWRPCLQLLHEPIPLTGGIIRQVSLVGTRSILREQPSSNAKLLHASQNAMMDTCSWHFGTRHCARWPCGRRLELCLQARGSGEDSNPAALWYLCACCALQLCCPNGPPPSYSVYHQQRWTYLEEFEAKVAFYGCW